MQSIKYCGENLLIFFKEMEHFKICSSRAQAIPSKFRHQFGSLSAPHCTGTDQ